MMMAWCDGQNTLTPQQSVVVIYAALVLAAIWCLLDRRCWPTEWCCTAIASWGVLDIVTVTILWPRWTQPTIHVYKPLDLHTHSSPPPWALFSHGLYACQLGYIAERAFRWRGQQLSCHCLFASSGDCFVAHTLARELLRCAQHMCSQFVVAHID